MTGQTDYLTSVVNFRNVTNRHTGQGVEAVEDKGDFKELVHPGSLQHQ